MTLNRFHCWRQINGWRVLPSVPIPTSDSKNAIERFARRKATLAFGVEGLSCGRARGSSFFIAILRISYDAPKLLQWRKLQRFEYGMERISLEFHMDFS
jgi:hypothetical protein